MTLTEEEKQEFREWEFDELEDFLWVRGSRWASVPLKGTRRSGVRMTSIGGDISQVLQNVRLRLRPEKEALRGYFDRMANIVEGTRTRRASCYVWDPMFCGFTDSLVQPEFHCHGIARVSGDQFIREVMTYETSVPGMLYWVPKS